MSTHEPVKVILFGLQPVVVVVVVLAFPLTLSGTFHLIPEINRACPPIFYTRLLYVLSIVILTSLSDRFSIWLFL